jgi:hypothetical protein
VTPDPIFDGEPTFKADRDAVHALMKFVNAIAEPSDRSAFAKGDEGNATLDGIPEELANALKTMSAAELAFLARLTRELEKAKLYDEYNPKLVYL